MHVRNCEEDCSHLQASYNSAWDAFKTSVKVPRLSNLMSPGPAASDNDSGAKHAWQALVLLFLGVAAATLNRGVGAKGASVLCPQAAVVLPFTLLFCRLQTHHDRPHEIDDNQFACAMKKLKQGLSLANIQVLCYLLLLLLMLLQGSMAVFSAPLCS